MFWLSITHEYGTVPSDASSSFFSEITRRVLIVDKHFCCKISSRRCLPLRAVRVLCTVFFETDSRSGLSSRQCVIKLIRSVALCFIIFAARQNYVIMSSLGCQAQSWNYVHNSEEKRWMLFLFFKLTHVIVL